MEEVKDVYRFVKPNDESYGRKSKLFLWCVDKWLPAVAGFDCCGPKIRKFKMPTQNVEVMKGVKKIAVSTDSEAFGLVVLENCRDKWSHIIPKKHEDPDWKPPAYDKEKAETHKWCKTLWSDNKVGQVKGGGWAPEAYTKFVASRYERSQNCTEF